VSCHNVLPALNVCVENQNLNLKTFAAVGSPNFILQNMLLVPTNSHKRPPIECMLLLITCLSVMLPNVSISPLWSHMQNKRHTLTKLVFLYYAVTWLLVN
jgi:hypothetical protein